MNNHHDLSDIPIKDAAAHIFRRPYLFVNPTSHMLEIATFLAIGPQIYVDGLVVIDENKKPIGRIGGKHIILNILKTGYPDWLKITALQIMDDFAGTTNMVSPLNRAVEIFDKTRFAFVPIITRRTANSYSLEEEEAVASLSIRDILPLIAKADLDGPIKDICSPLVSVDKNTSIRSAIDLMIKHGIRNIGITADDKGNDKRNNNNYNNKTKLLRIINDRKILEFLLSHNGRKIMHNNGIAGLADIGTINHLEMIVPMKVKYDTTRSRAAELLMDIRNPCLILEDNSIVSPWDIVMKTLRSNHTQIATEVR